ncbi:MAG: helix-turn-helix transcriptional regulator [Psychrobacter sp.]|nr:helix-turn-helix transcriptional regulator [Psychrobacter sp.]
MSKKVEFTPKEKDNFLSMLGNNLKIARKAASMSQTDVMRILWGVENNRNRICEIETGKKDISVLDFMLLQDLYKVSADYLLGLSVEYEVDALAGTVNHIVNQSTGLIEQMTSEFSKVLVNHLKKVSKGDNEALLEASKRLWSAIFKYIPSEDIPTDVAQAMSEVASVIRHIEISKARQQMQVETQMMQIKERMDKQDKHMMISDLPRINCLSNQLPLPMISINEIGDVNNQGASNE